MPVSLVASFTFVAVLMVSAAAGAQVPADLRAATEARDRAFYAVDAAQWQRYTAPSFTTVQQDGSFFTRSERLANRGVEQGIGFVDGPQLTGDDGEAIMRDVRCA